MPSVEASMLYALSKAKVPLFFLPGASVRRQKISLSNLPQVRKKPTRWIFRCSSGAVAISPTLIVRARLLRDFHSRETLFALEKAPQ